MLAFALYSHFYNSISIALIVFFFFFLSVNKKRTCVFLLLSNRSKILYLFSWKNLIKLNKITYEGLINFRFNGERKDWDQEDRKHNESPSDLLQEEKWTLEESLWTFCSLWCWSCPHCLLQPRPPLRVLQQQVIIYFSFPWSLHM